jgi:hypothetical protein
MVKGAASLQLVSGVALLRPDDVVFAAMLAGWRDQQACACRKLRPCRSGAMSVEVDAVHPAPLTGRAAYGETA